MRGNVSGERSERACEGRREEWGGDVRGGETCEGRERSEFACTISCSSPRFLCVYNTLWGGD